MKKLLLFLVILHFSCLPTGMAFLLFNLSLREAKAQEMSSQNFRIDGGNFNMTSGNKTSTNFKLSDVVGQTASGLFVSKGYYIQAGFLNAAAAAPFYFSVIPSIIDFGNLTANMPVEKTAQITISNGNMLGYQVFVSENQPLSTSAGAEIPDVICDTGDKHCTQSKAEKWTKDTTYGFGYRMSGKTVPTDFAKEDYFRPFPATRRNEKEVTVMTSKAKKVTDKAAMILRVKVNSNQPVGQYHNVLTFTALAGI